MIDSIHSCLYSLFYVNHFLFSTFISCSLSFKVNHQPIQFVQQQKGKCVHEEPSEIIKKLVTFYKAFYCYGEDEIQPQVIPHHSKETPAVKKFLKKQLYIIFKQSCTFSDSDKISPLRNQVSYLLHHHEYFTCFIEI